MSDSATLTHFQVPIHPMGHMYNHSQLEPQLQPYSNDAFNSHLTDSGFKNTSYPSVSKTFFDTFRSSYWLHLLSSIVKIFMINDMTNNDITTCRPESNLKIPRQPFGMLARKTTTLAATDLDCSCSALDRLSRLLSFHVTFHGQSRRPTGRARLQVTHVKPIRSKVGRDPHFHPLRN